MRFNAIFMASYLWTVTLLRLAWSIIDFERARRHVLPTPTKLNNALINLSSAGHKRRPIYLMHANLGKFLFPLSVPLLFSYLAKRHNTVTRSYIVPHAPIAALVKMETASCLNLYWDGLHSLVLITSPVMDIWDFMPDSFMHGQPERVSGYGSILPRRLTPRAYKHFGNVKHWLSLEINMHFSTSSWMTANAQEHDFFILLSVHHQFRTYRQEFRRSTRLRACKLSISHIVPVIAKQRDRLLPWHARSRCITTT
jgi:hypothetical protein